MSKKKKLNLQSLGLVVDDDFNRIDPHKEMDGDATGEAGIPLTHGADQYHAFPGNASASFGAKCADEESGGDTKQMFIKHDSAAPRHNRHDWQNDTRRQAHLGTYLR